MLGTENMIIDTTVFIQFFRNSQKAIDFLSNPPEDLSTSRVVVMEILAGVRNKEAAIQVEKQLFELGIEIIEIDEEVSILAGQLYRDYFYTEGIGIMDAFVAATALVGGLKLGTHNTKHFKFIKGLDLTVPF